MAWYATCQIQQRGLGTEPYHDLNRSSRMRLRSTVRFPYTCLPCALVYSVQPTRAFAESGMQSAVAFVTPHSVRVWIRQRFAGRRFVEAALGSCICLKLLLQRVIFGSGFQAFLQVRFNVENMYRWIVAMGSSSVVAP